MSCRVPDVDNWFEYNCNQVAQDSGQDFYNSLFINTYPTMSGVYLPYQVDDDILQFQYLLVDMCNTAQNGQRCKEPLEILCQGYTREDMANPVVRSMCGCYLPSTEYVSGIPRSCDTICSKSGTIKYYSSSSSQVPETCSTNVCIIDNVTINIQNSSAGDITFSQVCPLCSPTEQCRCIIDNINIIVEESSIGQASITQNCASGITTCYAYNENNERVEVSCDDYFGELSTNPSVYEQLTSYYRSTGWILLIAGIAVLILFILGLSQVLQVPTPVYKYDIYQTQDAITHVDLINPDGSTVPIYTNLDKAT